MRPLIKDIIINLITTSKSPGSTEGLCPEINIKARPSHNTHMSEKQKFAWAKQTQSGSFSNHSDDYILSINKKSSSQITLRITVLQHA